MDAPVLLVVDDDPATLRLTAVVLETEGLLVERFELASEAIDRLLDPSLDPPRLIIVDLSMPEMNGREFFRRIREAGIRVPVMILSAFGASAAMRELGAEGAMDKPFDPDALAARVKEIIGET